MDKEKIVMSVIFGLIFFILVSTIFMQFNTIDKTDVVSIKNMREADLRTEITTWTTRLEEAKKKYEETIIKKEEYESSIEDNEKAMNLLEEDLAEAQMLLGLTDVVGDGVIITLENNENKSIVADDLLELINELRLAGAEAISINDERVTINSHIADIEYTYIVVNRPRCSSPYIVKAIGNQSYLESGLSAKQYGYIDKMKAIGKTASVEKVNDIVINKYKEQIKLDNIVVNETE